MPGWNKDIDNELSLDIILEEERQRKEHEKEAEQYREDSVTKQKTVAPKQKVYAPENNITFEEVSPLPFDFTFTPKFKPGKEVEVIIDPKRMDADEEKIRRKKIEEQQKIAAPQITQNINPIPVYNEKIEHKIIPPDRPTVYKTRVETDKYRSRFINRPVQNLEKTAEHEALSAGKAPVAVERPGLIKKKSQFSSTADLEPLPTIISAELMQVDDSSKTIVTKTLGKKEAPEEIKEKEEVEGQLKLTGFDDKELEPDQIDEELAEEMVRLSREEKIKAFMLETNKDASEFVDDDEEDEQEKETEEEKSAVQMTEIKPPVRRKREKIKLKEEYKVLADKQKISAVLASRVRQNIVSVCILSIVEAFLIAVAMLVKPEGSSGLLIDTDICLLVNFVLLAAAFFSSMKTVLGGIKAAINLKPNADTAAAVTFLAAGIQNVVFFFCMDKLLNHVNLLSAASVLVLLLNTVGKLVINLRIQGNFNFITNGTLLHSFEDIRDEDDAFEIGRGLLIGEPDVRYSSRIGFPMHFLNQSYKNDPADKLSGKLSLISFGVAVVVGVIVTIITKDVADAVTAFTGICCVCVPCACLITSNLPLFRANKFLNNHGGMIAGHEAVADSAEANAVVFDASDLFKRGGCNIHGIKTFNGMRIDESILYAASLVVHSNGPLEDVFDKVVLGRKELLPELDSLVYEDKLGLSAWIHERRVLFGNRELLINHNIEVPAQETEEQYFHDGRKIMYLAVAGKIAAMFVVSYKADDFTAQKLQQIEKSGLTILIRTSDANITEELIAEYFKLPMSGVKVISAVAGKIYMGYREETVARAEAKLVHNGTNDMFLRTLCMALSLNGKRTLSNIVQIAGSGLGALIIASLSFMSGVSQISIGALMLYQLFWAVIAILISVVKKQKR